MEEKLTYNSKEYCCRWIDIFDKDYLIGPECLEKAILSEDISYASDEAKAIDEMIFFYVPDCFIDAEETFIKSYVQRYVC